jgi:hypothetical protein
MFPQGRISYFAHCMGLVCLMFPQGRISYFAHCIGFGLPNVPTGAYQILCSLYWGWAAYSSHRGVPNFFADLEGGGGCLPYCFTQDLQCVFAHFRRGEGEESDVLTNVPFSGVTITLLHLWVRGLLI